MILPAGRHVNDDVSGCAVVVDIQQEADVQLEKKSVCDFKCFQ